ncbi:MAG: hypothetical protein ACRDOJ_11450, partial [Nocardioidaceae bacterium]
MTSQPPVDLVLAGFSRALRHAGVTATVDRTQAFVRSVAAVGADTPGGVYWAGRSTLCSRPDDFDIYDRVFAAGFGGEVPTASR